jgi:hypothetical protein
LLDDSGSGKRLCIGRMGKMRTKKMYELSPIRTDVSRTRNVGVHGITTALYDRPTALPPNGHLD